MKAAGTLTPEEWRTIWEWYSGRCAWCEIRPGTEQDHVHPISRGGRHVAENIVLACHGCNSAKGSSLRWVLKRPHPFMVKAQAEARALALAESFEMAGLDMGGER